MWGRDEGHLQCGKTHMRLPTRLYRTDLPGPGGQWPIRLGSTWNHFGHWLLRSISHRVTVRLHCYWYGVVHVRRGCIEEEDGWMDSHSWPLKLFLPWMQFWCMYYYCALYRWMIDDRFTSWHLLRFMSATIVCANIRLGNERMPKMLTLPAHYFRVPNKKPIKNDSGKIIL